MSFSRKVERKAIRTYDRIIQGGQRKAGPDGQPLHVIGSSQAEALAALRAVPVPPAPDGAADTDRDDVDPVAYRRDRNARKRARRAARSQ